MVYEQVIKSQQYKYQFEDIQSDRKKLQEFQIWFKAQTAKKFNVQPESIQIYQITKGSINVKFSIKAEHQPDGSLKAHNFFKYFHLSADLFCTEGNKVYPFEKNNQQYGKIHWRGGWPYFVPVRCSRYGLNVKGNYDGGYNTWLSMKGKPGQWAIAYHGIKQPEHLRPSSNQKCFNALMEGLGRDKTMFKVQKLNSGGRQAYQANYSRNTNELIGDGIYCTPHISTAVQYANQGVTIQIGGKKQVYHVVLMCRVYPQKIKVCPQHEDYFLINQPQDIRPYGIILVKQEDKRNYPSAKELYGVNQFTWDRYKEAIMKNLSKS